MSQPTSKPTVAIIERDAKQRRQIAACLEGDFEIIEADDYQEAYRLLHEAPPEVLLLELNAVHGGVTECCRVLRELEQSGLDTLVIVLSDDDKKATALRAMDAGAFDYWVKPVDCDVFRTILNRAVEKLRIERENRVLRQELYRKEALGDLLGSTEVMRNLFESIRRVARSDSTVVIRGESGTGKELVARAIHDLSPRRSRPFVSVNGAALPETLMEAELFGYEKGAFTGATATKEGRLELAHRGTLFLDEIATLSLALQTKLLRVLEEHALVRLGGKKSIRVDFRLVTATNEDLEALVRRGSFREDLYYRIHVFPLVVPPLRERQDDIPLLVDYFVRVFCVANHLEPKRVDDEALATLRRYPWPGNIRELQNVVQRVVLMTDEDLISVKNLPREIVETAGRRAENGFRLRGGFRLPEALAAYERQWVEAALAEAKGVKTQAAQLLGIGKDQMKYLCRKYKL